MSNVATRTTVLNVTHFSGSVLYVASAASLRGGSQTNAPHPTVTGKTESSEQLCVVVFCEAGSFLAPLHW